MFDGENLATGPTRSYNASTQLSGYNAYKAFDEDKTTRWSSTGDEYNDGWLEVDFGQTLTFNHVVIKKYNALSQSKSFKIQYYDGSWHDAYTGGYIGHTRICVFNPTTASKMRIAFTNETTGTPSIYEVKVFNTEFD